MKKIRNPFTEPDDGTYNCFGCSPSNPSGLHLTFWANEEKVVAAWKPESRFEGFNGILHGGIQATLMDEVAAWYVFSRLGTAGVTTDMHIRYTKPLPVSLSAVYIEAIAQERDKKQVRITCSITDEEGREYSRGEITYYLFPEKVARDKYNYPGQKAFLAD